MLAKCVERCQLSRMPCVVLTNDMSRVTDLNLGRIEHKFLVSVQPIAVREGHDPRCRETLDNITNLQQGKNYRFG